MFYGSRNLGWMPLVLGATLALAGGGCESTGDPEPEPQIATMRLTIGGSQTVNVTGQSAPGGSCVASQPIAIARNATTTIAASFLNAAGQPDPIANDPGVFRLAGSDNPAGAEPAPTPNTITWTRTGSFAGTLLGTVATTSGSVLLSAFHLEEGHADFGPCAVPITVTP